MTKPLPTRQVLVDEIQTFPASMALVVSRIRSKQAEGTPQSFKLVFSFLHVFLNYHKDVFNEYASFVEVGSSFQKDQETFRHLLDLFDKQYRLYRQLLASSEKEIEQFGKPPTISTNEKQKRLKQVINKILNRILDLSEFYEVSFKPPFPFFMPRSPDPDIVKSGFELSSTSKKFIQDSEAKNAIQNEENLFDFFSEELLDKVCVYLETIKEKQTNLQEAVDLFAKDYNKLDRLSKKQKVINLGTEILQSIYDPLVTGWHVADSFMSTKVFNPEEHDPKNFKSSYESATQKSQKRKKTNLFAERLFEAFMDYKILDLRRELEDQLRKIDASLLKDYIAVLNQTKKKWSVDFFDHKILKNGYFFSIYFCPLVLDRDGTLVDPLFGKLFVKSPWELTGAKVSVSNAVEYVTFCFKALAHLPFLGDQGSRRERLLDFLTATRTTLLDSKRLHDTFSGVVNLFWLDFKKVELGYDQATDSYYVIKDSLETPYIRETSVEQLEKGREPAKSMKPKPSREEIYLNSWLYQLNSNPDSFQPEGAKGKRTVSSVVLLEFRGFCLYPAEYQVDTISTRVRNVFSSPAQVYLQRFDTIPNLTKIYPEQFFFSKFYNFIYNSVIPKTQRDPIWVKLVNEKRVQDLQTCVPIKASYGPSRLFSLPSSVDQFKKDRDFVYLAALHMVIEEFLKYQKTNPFSFSSKRRVASPPVKAPPSWQDVQKRGKPVETPEEKIQKIRSWLRAKLAANLGMNPENLENLLDSREKG